jgi:hypothetical protein
MSYYYPVAREWVNAEDRWQSIVAEMIKRLPNSDNSAPLSSPLRPFVDHQLKIHR